MSDEIQDAVRQWIAKAKIDWSTVAILRRDAAAPGEAICFHCQQYAEKLLKGILTLHGVEAPRTHDLGRLIQLAAPLAPGLDGLADGADRLSLHGVRTRYPDEWGEVTDDEMRQMIQTAQEIAALLLPLLEQSTAD